MVSADRASGVASLQVLAGHLDATALMYVRRDSTSLRIQTGGTSEAADEAADEARRAGTDWLAAMGSGATPSPSPPSRRDKPPEQDGTTRSPVLLAPVESASGAVLGVVAACRDGAWTDDQRALFRYAVASNARSLDPRAVPTRDPATSDIEAGFEAALRAAVDNGELRLDYQPEFDLVTGSVLAVEALVRWQHPRYGELGPEWFIPLAERSDLIDRIGGWVIDEAVQALAAWRATSDARDLTLRVNASPVQLTGTAMVETIASTLDRHDVPGSRLCLELTENAPYTDVLEVARVVRRLHSELGVHAAIDDFATGYSTLSHLRVLPVDTIKVDRSLVSGIDADRRAQSIVTALVGLALGFGLDVVAEGVETAGEAATLIAVGCTRAQGHYLARPMPAAEFETLLRQPTMPI